MPECASHGCDKAIYRDDHLEVVHLPRPSSYAVVTFAPRDYLAKADRFWGDVLAKNFGVECFGVSARQDSWYPAKSMRPALAAILARATKPLIGYGHSMGGYAALKFSRLLGLVGVVASAPQISIAPGDVPDDLRFRYAYVPDLHDDMVIGVDDIAGRIVIAHDPTYADDLPHMQRIASLAPMEQFFAHHTGHRVSICLSPRDFLLPTFEAFLSGTSIAIPLRAARQIKKRQTDYLIFLARKCLIRRKPNWALAILNLVARGTSLHFAEREHFTARAWKQLGNNTFAKAAYGRALALWPEHAAAARELKAMS